MSIMLNSLPVYSSAQFSCSKGTLVAEASDLGGGRMFGQVYDDACDEGFVVRSEKTGTRMAFAICEYLVDKHENELQGWILEPAKLADKRKFPNLKVKVYND